jgi:hypothetical protein
MKIIEWDIENNWSKLNRLAKTPWFTQHPVHNPKHYCVTSLPPKAKVYIREKYTTWLNGWFKDWCMSLPKDYILENSKSPMAKKVVRSWDRDPQVLFEETEYHLNKMLEFMDSEDTSHTLINFIDHTRKLDESRGQNFAETCPEVNEFIQEWVKENDIRI